MVTNDWCEPSDGMRYITTRSVRSRFATFNVDAGFEFDVSIPVWLWWLYDPQNARYLRAACFHDAMLREGWGNVESAGVFGSALKADGVPWYERWPMVLAVAVFA